MHPRSWPVLVVGFGAVVVLVTVSGFVVQRKVVTIEAQLIRSQNAYIQAEQLRRTVQSSVLEANVLVRDFLLDPSHLQVEAYQRELREVRDAAEESLEALSKMGGAPEQEERLGLLKKEVGRFWQSLEPVFGWTPQQKAALGSLFLRRQVLPRRTSILALTEQIGNLEVDALRKNQLESQAMQQDLSHFLRWATAVAASLSLLVAALSIYRTAALETKADRQRDRAEQAEQELRQLSQRLVMAQEEERKHLSRELHDEIGQKLTAIRMEAASLNRQQVDPETFALRLSEIRRLAEQTLSTVRQMAMGLRPAMLDDLGLAPALEWQAKEFMRHAGASVEVQIDGSIDHLPERHRVCVYRVTQEALTNCARHAHANSIRINVIGRSDAVSVAIQDDGIGFDPSVQPERGLGLISIEERVRELGGRISIYTQPQRGTLLRVEIPVPATVPS